LVYRQGPGGVEFLLVHPGGPFWRRRDDGAWSIPKGLVDAGEDPLAAAAREFAEETGLSVAGGELVPLVERRQRSGKIVRCWLTAADLDLKGFRSNIFEMEWPRHSGRMLTLPECDRAAYFATEVALRKILPGQRGFIEEAAARIERGQLEGAAC
jgi:predicted NUDIX family NTP pyrophosphohydrolase